MDEKNAEYNGYYFPRILDTCGSFAIALDHSIFDEIIAAASAIEAPFDLFPLGEIYERHIGKCFVCYPNIVMPDVSTSSIRGARCQHTHAKEMKWPLEEFDYPLSRPIISLFITSQSNVKLKFRQ